MLRIAVGVAASGFLLVPSVALAQLDSIPGVTWRATAEVRRFHDSLPPEVRAAIYEAVLQHARTIVANVWGEPSSWAEICGTEPTKEPLTITLDPRVRTGAMPDRFGPELDAGWLASLVERGISDAVCDPTGEDRICPPGSTTMTLSLSVIEPAPDDGVQFRLQLGRGPNCPNREDHGGFGAEFLIRVAPEGAGWKPVGLQQLWIT